MITNENMKSVCPHCNYEMDCATPVEGSPKPKPVDISICINCAAINVFTDEEGHIRATTDDDIKNFESNLSEWFKVQRVQRILRAMNHVREGQNRCQTQ